MKPFRHSLIGFSVFAIAQLSAAGCGTEQQGLPLTSNPDAGFVCEPPFCIPITPDAASGTTSASGDAASKPKPGGQSTTPTMIGVPVTGGVPVPFVGGGVAGAAPLAPGCTPASALECPTVSGACATSATSNPTGTVQGVLCAYGGPYTVAAGKPAATVEYLRETAGGRDYYRFRITFDPSFVDNTYGANAIGWGDKGHTWKDLLGSDHAELELFDNNHVMVMQLKLDYIGIDATQSCGYASLGATGGDGKVLVGDPKHLLGSTSSLARNLEGCGYCTSPACNGDCRIDSPATDAKWSANPAAPNWDFRVRYETWIDAAVFGASGFGGVNISYVHASPSKESSNTITVIPGPCPPPADGCPPGMKEYVTPAGVVTCVPETDTPSTEECPEGTIPIAAPDGTIVCCPPGTEVYVSSDGRIECVVPIPIP